MSLERTSMKVQKEILRMREKNCSTRIIARSLKVSRNTVRKVFAREDQGISMCDRNSPHNKDFDMLDWKRLEKEVLIRKTPY